MRAFATFLGFTAFSLIAAALLFYPAWLGIGALTDLEPHKILSRLAKILAAVALVFLLRHLRLWDKRLLGYGQPPRRFVMDIVAGLALGVAIMAVVFTSLVLLGVRQWDTGLLTLSGLLGIASKALFAGLAIGIIEETFFRGAIYAGIRRESGLWPAVFLSSLIYAALHFVRTQPFEATDIIGWTSGLPLLLGAFHQFGGSGIWDSFAALFAAGMFLALIRAWTGSIALAIGVHAGWVAVIKTGKKLTDPAPAGDWAFLSGSYDGVIGWLATAWLVVLIMAITPRALAADGRREGPGGQNPGPANSPSGH